MTLISCRGSLRCFHFLRVACSVMLLLIEAQADWPQFLGPTRDGVYAGKALSERWPSEGPRQLWARAVGQGFSGPIAVGDRVFLFHRQNDRDLLECFEARTGKTVWQEGVPATYRDDFGFDEGPRATPAVQEDRIVAIGADALVQCRNITTGKQIWEVDCRKKFGARKAFFGFAPSPLIQNGKVILAIGGTEGAGVIALNLDQGTLAWKSGEDEASHASPIATTIQGRQRLLILTREALVSLNPLDGHELFRYPWRPSMSASVSAATPLVISDRVLLSASYGVGSVLLECSDSGAKPLWERKDALSSHYSTSVTSEGFIYGFDGRQEQGCDLRCVEVTTGAVRWTQDGFGAGSVILAGKELILLSEKGELIRAAADPSAFKAKAKAQILPFLARAHPALSDGVLYARSKDKLFAHALAETLPSKP